MNKSRRRKITRTQKSSSGNRTALIFFILILFGGCAYAFYPRYKKPLKRFWNTYLSNPNSRSNHHPRKVKTPTPEGNAYGIDVSKHQGEIDWTKVRTWNDKKLQFVYVKATEGSTLRDKKYVYNLLKAKQNGFKVGSYHYFIPWADPDAQFEHFLNRIEPYHQDLLPMIDLEDRRYVSKTEYLKRVRRFLQLCEDKFKRKPVLYSLQSFYNQNFSGEFSDYKWVMARYSNRPPNLSDDHPWFLWQFTHQGVVDGIDNYVDVNVLGDGYSLKQIEWKRR